MNVLTEIKDRQDDSYKILDETGSLADVDILRKPETRKKTDQAFLIVFGVAIVLLLPFLIYTLYYSDINRLHGYDNCGNICGQKNIKDDRWECTGEDMTLKPVHLSYSKKCEIEHGYSSFYTEKNLFKFIHIAIWKFALVSFLPLAVSLIFVVLFRYLPTVAVWSILILCWLIFVAALGYVTIILTLFVYGSWALTISCVIVVTLIFSWALLDINKIRAATVLLKVATRAVFEVNKISYVSIAALCVSLLIFLTYTIITFHTMTAGKLKEQYPNSLFYYCDDLMITTKVFNAIIAAWAIMFVFGAQDMILSGAVRKWYTTRNQNNMFDTVPVTVATALSYHLGTVVLGCLLTAVMYIPRAVIYVLAQFSAMKEKSSSWLKFLNGYFTNNAYIITATDGTSYIQSGKKATRLLRQSVGNTSEINSFGNSVILMAQGLVVFISTWAGYLTLHFAIGRYHQYVEYFTLVEAGIAYICAHSILGTLKISANTLFFCASEELVRNKEANLPYTMPLSELLDGSNKLFLQKVHNKPFSNVVGRSLYIKLFLVVFVLVSCFLFLIAYFIGF